MSLLLRDSASVPGVFLWNGAVDELILAGVVSVNGWIVPPDLYALWSATGGGWIYETEHILQPIPSTGASDDVGAVTRWYQAAGLMHGLIVIHQGLGLTAVRVDTGSYLYFDSVVQPLRMLAEYASLNEWYVATLRSEYAERYGLAALGSAGL